MKLQTLSLILLASLTISLSSCLKDSCEETRTFIEMERNFITPEEMRIAPTLSEPRDLVNPGKIYFYDKYIILNELREGVHIIDNSDPSNPDNIGFIEIPGNVDIAVTSNVMYADNYADLLSIDISNLQNPSLLTREESVFEDHFFHQIEGFFVEWVSTERTIEIECADPRFSNHGFWQDDILFFDANLSSPSANIQPSVGGGLSEISNLTGVGGSLARFTITKEHLYVINNGFELISFDISNPTTPVWTDGIDVSWGIETLFPYGDNLFIGANAGMFIYDLSTPSSPEYVSEFEHARACDPVYVKDDIAYVTLRDGTTCQNFTNQLEVIDVKDIFNPSLIRTYGMSNPHGLSVADNNLYICEGDFGLKVFDVEDLRAIDKNQLAHFEDIKATDVITLGSDHLMLIGSDGLYQFDTTDPTNIKQLSHLSVQR